MQQKNKQKNSWCWILTVCFVLTEQMALKGSFSLISWDQGRGPNPLPSPLQLTNSKVPSWHQLWAVSFVSCNPSSFLPPPMPNRSFGKGKKEKNLTGFQLFFCLFLPDLMLLEWGGSLSIEPPVFSFLSWQLPFLLLPWESFLGLRCAPSLWHGGGTVLQLRSAPGV